MQLYIRRILLTLSCLAFAIIAPLIILYAMGYRGSLVGVALVEATPRRASVEVEGEQYGTLPRSIPNLSPGVTTIRVTKEGYRAWEKNINIQPGISTDLRSIQLLPERIEQETVIQTSTLFALSPTSLIASVSEKGALEIYSPTGEAMTKPVLLSSTQSPTKLVWSPDSMFILVSFPKDTYEVFRVSGEILERIPSNILNGNKDVQWDPTNSGKLFCITSDQTLVSYNVSTKAIETVTSSINTYAIDHQTLVFQTTDTALWEQRIGSKEKKQIITDTGKSMRSIVPGGSSFRALLFADGTLQLVTKQGERQTIAQQSQRVLWSPNGTTLLVQTDKGELHTYLPEGISRNEVPADELHLVVRLSTPITPLTWLPDSQHILYETNDMLIHSETDTRDYAITTAIQEHILHPQVISIEEDGKSILSLQTNRNTSSLVRTWLVNTEDR